MEKTFTQPEQSMTQSQTSNRARRTHGPRQQTLAILRQFARAYQPAPAGGFILN